MIIYRVEHNRHRLRRVQVQVCTNRFERGRGLLLRKRLDHDTAMLLPHCRAVHTVGMHYRIDVMFCDAHGRILRITENVGPCRVVHEPGAQHVWEVDAGTVRRWGWQIGDRILPC